ncbi:MAG: TauD/TfdA family dioxygenase [Aquabacterium sp.]|nr:TauD/TfdA family dioxygenase [Aquabacterium sp.]
MNAPTRPDLLAPLASPFDLDDEAPYQRWRDAKLAAAPIRAQDVVVDIANPRALTPIEHGALLQRLSTSNLVVYRGPSGAAGKSVLVDLAAQLGLRQLDSNWLADEDGISHITQSAASDGRGGFIPYTDRAIRWHTDGYYHPGERRIRSMLLHCVRPAREGGHSALLDHEIAYIALRDASTDYVRALMAPDAMTIPAREDDDGVARPAQSGPVFSVDPADGRLHMRYTARTRSIEWKNDAATRRAADFLQALLASALPQVLRLRLEAGMGVVAHNVLHDRSAFSDDPAAPRLLYRARYRDLTAAPELPWRNG